MSKQMPPKVISGGDNPYDIHDAKLSSSATAHESSSVTAHEISNTLSPEDVLELYEKDKSEAMLAKCLAVASNQTGWIGHDLDDEDCTEYTRELFESWWTLYKRLVSDIRDILIKENNNGMNHVIENIGTHYMIKPVLERNGFRDGCGWWVSKDE